MRFTKACDYAFRLMSNLARLRAEGPQSIQSLAGHFDIPRRFLANIVQKLAAARLVETTKGVKGGLLLSRDPSEINLLEVYEAVEGCLEMSTCQRKEGCPHQDYCIVSPELTRLRETIAESLRAVTLADMVNRHGDKPWCPSAPTPRPDPVSSSAPS